MTWLWYSLYLLCCIELGRACEIKGTNGSMHIDFQSCCVSHALTVCQLVRNQSSAKMARRSEAGTIGLCSIRALD